MRSNLIAGVNAASNNAPAGCSPAKVVPIDDRPALDKTLAHAEDLARRVGALNNRLSDVRMRLTGCMVGEGENSNPVDPVGIVDQIDGVLALLSDRLSDAENAVERIAGV